jgi:hypothetical protein
MKVRLLNRVLTLTALSLAILLLLISPRGLFARPPQIARGQGTKRPHPPRNLLPERVYEVARARRTTREPREHVVACLKRAAPQPLPARAAVDLATPDYLRLYEEPQHQTSPPA